MDTAFALGLYGSIISTILLLFKIAEHSQNVRKLAVDVKRNSILNSDTRNFHNGRKGDQFLQIKVTNKSSKDNSIEDIHLVTDNIWGFPNKFIELNFTHSSKLPIKLSYTDQVVINLPLTMPPGESQTSRKNNIELLKELKKGRLFVQVIDTQGRKYLSNTIRLEQLIEDVYKEEETLTTEQYRVNGYRR